MANGRTGLPSVDHLHIGGRGRADDRHQRAVLGGDRRQYRSIGALLRNTAAAIATFAGVFFVIPQLAGLLPAGIRDHVAPYFAAKATVSEFHVFAPIVCQ